MIKNNDNFNIPAGEDQSDWSNSNSDTLENYLKYLKNFKRINGVNKERIDSIIKKKKLKRIVIEK